MHSQLRLLSVFVAFTIVLAAAARHDLSVFAKKKDQLPVLILTARTAVVVIDPEAGVSATSPFANKKAQEDVELALTKWGRFKLVQDPQSADIVIVIRKSNGKMVQPTIGGLPTNDRPVIVQQTDSSIRLGGAQGRAPGSAPQTRPEDTSPTPQVEAGTPDDTFFVYQGGQGSSDRSYDERPSLWRYSNKNALRSPEVPAVTEFRKAIEESEKQQQQQQQQKKSKP
jgi:hypothetical protein